MVCSCILFTKQRPPTTICTSLIFLHKYNKFLVDEDHEEIEKLKKIDVYLMIMAIMNLAAKVTENDRKIRDIINVSNAILHNNELMEINEKYWKIKETVALTEFFLLRVLNFQIHVEVALPWITRIVNESFAVAYRRGFPESVNPSGYAVLSLAIGFSNDFYLLPEAVNFSARSIAATTVFLSFIELQMRLQLEPKEWFLFWGDCELSTVWKILELLFNMYRKSE